MAMLGAICVGYVSFVRWKIRLKGQLSFRLARAGYSPWMSRPCAAA